SARTGSCWTWRWPSIKSGRRPVRSVNSWYWAAISSLVCAGVIFRSTHELSAEKKLAGRTRPLEAGALQKPRGHREVQANVNLVGVLQERLQVFRGAMRQDCHTRDCRYAASSDQFDDGAVHVLRPAEVVGADNHRRLSATARIASAASRAPSNWSSSARGFRPGHSFAL